MIVNYSGIQKEKLEKAIKILGKIIQFFKFCLSVKASQINQGFSILSVGKGQFDKLGFVFLILIVGKDEFILNSISYKENLQ